jgi:hypothetical protein
MKDAEAQGTQQNGEVFHVEHFVQVIMYILVDTYMPLYRKHTKQVTVRRTLRAAIRPADFLSFASAGSAAAFD